MVTLLEDSDRRRPTWILRPTRSMSWAQAKCLMLLVAATCLSIGGFFWALGLPLVLPFSGLEAAAVAIAFYVVLREGERREVIRLDAEQLVIERGFREPEDRFEFNRFWVRVELQPGAGRLHPHRLLIRAHGRAIEIGRFLTEGERESFAGALINALRKNR